MSSKQDSNKTNDRMKSAANAGLPAAIILFAVVFCAFVAVPWSKKPENALLFSPIKGDLLSGRDYHAAGMDVVRRIGMSEQRVSQLTMEARSADSDRSQQLRARIKGERNNQFNIAKSGLRLLSQAEVKLKRAAEASELSAADNSRLGESLLWQAELLPSMPRVDATEIIRLKEDARTYFEQALKMDPQNGEARNGMFVLTDLGQAPPGMNDGHNHDHDVPVGMPESPEFADNLGGYIMAGNWWFDEAAARYEHLHGGGSQSEINMIVEMFTKAIESYEKAIEADPGNANVLTDCGIMYFYRSQLGGGEMVMESVMGAMQMYNAALEAQPEFPPALYNMVKMYATIGDVEKIKEFGQRYLDVTIGVTDDPNVPMMRSEIESALAMLADQ